LVGVECVPHPATWRSTMNMIIAIIRPRP
jgi:hypothetical protein